MGATVAPHGDSPLDHLAQLGHGDRLACRQSALPDPQGHRELGEERLATFRLKSMDFGRQLPEGGEFVLFRNQRKPLLSILNANDDRRAPRRSYHRSEPVPPQSSTVQAKV